MSLRLTDGSRYARAAHALAKPQIDWLFGLHARHAQVLFFSRSGFIVRPRSGSYLESSQLGKERPTYAPSTVPRVLPVDSRRAFCPLSPSLVSAGPTSLHTKLLCLPAHPAATRRSSGIFRGWDVALRGIFVFCRQRRELIDALAYSGNFFRILAILSDLISRRAHTHFFVRFPTTLFVSASLRS